MVSVKDIALEFLMPNLGVPKFSYNQVRFNCPICDKGNKYNLEINVDNLIFHCWSCHYKGHLKKLLISYAKNNAWEGISELKNTYQSNISKKVLENSNLRLPNGLVPFYLNKDVENYLINERKIDKNTLIERKVSYVYLEDELLYDHIVFPFYDITGTILTGFSVQNFKTKKYKNFGKRNFVPYIQYINVNYPITLTEGIYDSLSSFNAIPLLGTDICTKILEFICGKNVILAVDNEVTKSEKNKMIFQLKQYNANLIYMFIFDEYKDLNEFRQQDLSQLILKYKFAVETIFENN